MLITLLVILLITGGGTVLTYLYEKEESLLARVCAGNIIGSTFLAIIAFLVACVSGLNQTTVLISLLIGLAPFLLLTQKTIRERLTADWLNATKQLSGADFHRVLRFVYYAAFLILLYLFFSRAIFETPQGIYTGDAQNLGDLPFHLGAIFSFIDGQNFPPENPSYAFAKFTYPFMVDLLTSCFVTLGAKVPDAILWQNVTLGFSLVVLLENFARHLTKNRLAGKLTPVIFLLCGGLGFLIFFRNYWHDGRSILEFLWNLPDEDYTIRVKSIRWGNSLTTLLLTQRSLLLGMPVTLIVLTKLWKIFTAEKEEIKLAEQGSRVENSFGTYDLQFTAVFIGLLAGTLPLVHMHSLAVLFVVAAFLFVFRLDQWRLWLMFGISTALIAVPELLWAMTGSATRLTEFFDWNFGWDAQGENIFIFWLKNLGLFLPLLILGIYFILTNAGTRKEDSQEDGDTENTQERPKTKDQRPKTTYYLLIFYLPFLLIFIVANLVKLAPWQWDNIKVLIYWYVCSVPFVAWILAKIWEKKAVLKIIAAVSFLILVFSGGLDVWRVVSRQINYRVFSRDSINIAEQIKDKTAPNALFLNAPTYNSAVVLSGRRSLMRYSGHLSSYGIDYGPREEEVKRIYEGTALARDLLRKNKIEYVLISPEERSNLTVNDAFFSSFPVIAEAGEYRVYQIK